MAILICKVTGSRGRSMDVYDNKCVITTDVTLGSILTNNALDGQKTIFYIDVKGIQFKKSGLTLGYLQLETSSVQMNNMSSNMFSENTFTFDAVGNEDVNYLMEVLRNYIENRIESYKYGTPAEEKHLDNLLKAARDVPACRIDSAISLQHHNRLQEQERLRQHKLAEEKAEAEAAQRKALEDFRRAVSESGGNSTFGVFLEGAAACTRVAEILKLWKTFPWENTPGAALIEQKITEAAKIERMYGADAKSVQKLLDTIRQMDTLS